MTSERAGWLLTLVLAVVGTIGLAGPGLWGGDTLPAGAFHPGHAFFAWHLGTVPAGGVLTQPPLGWPGSPSVQLIGGVPLAVAALLSGLGPLRAYGVALLVGPLLTAVATWGWLARWSRGTVGARSAATLSFVLSSFALAALGNGQLAKMQLWVLPGTLWALDGFMDRAHLRSGLCLLGVTVLGVLSAPSLAVQIPVAAGIQLVATDGLARWRSTWMRGGASLVVIGLGLLPGLWFLGAAEDAGTRPAVAGTGERVGGAAPSASLDDLLFGLGARADGLDAINHAPVLAFSVMVAGVWLAWRVGVARRLGLALLLGGGVLALGPVLRWGADPVSLGSWTLSLPASWLTSLGYPMGRTGQWYRFVVVASLGLALLVSRAQTPRATRWVSLAVLLGVVQAVHQSGHPFPRSAVSIPASESMNRLRSGGPPGAVVVLPLIANTADGGMGLAMGALAARHTSAMARHTEGHASTVALRAVMQQAQSARSVDAAHRVLAEAGVAVVVWRPGARVMRGEVWLDEAAVTEALGPPELDNGTSVWWVDVER